LEDAQNGSSKGQASFSTFLKNDALGIFQFLESFIVDEKLSVSGGIILVGWSMCSLWMTAFLAYAHTYPMTSVSVDRYIRRVVTYGALYV